MLFLVILLILASNSFFKLTRYLYGKTTHIFSNDSGRMYLRECFRLARMFDCQISDSMFEMRNDRAIMTKEPWEGIKLP